MATLIKKYDLPFVSGFALQNYLQAEEGIFSAYINKYQHWYIDGSLSNEIPEKWNSSRIENIHTMIEKYNVKPIFHGNFKVPLASDVKALRLSAIKYTKREIDLASNLSSPIIIHGGAIVEPRLVNSIKKEALKNFLNSIENLSNYAAKKNVDIYLENLSFYKNYLPFHYIFTSEEDFQYIFSATDAKFFLDIGHANIGNNSPISIFNKYHHRIVGMSFSNNNGQQDQHRSLSKGIIDYQKLVESIIFKKWKGIIAFETRDVSPDESIEDLIQIYNNIFIEPARENFLLPELSNLRSISNIRNEK